MSNNKFSNIILNKEILTINLLNLNKLSDTLIEIRPVSLYKIIKLQKENVEKFLENFIIFDFYASVSNENSEENESFDEKMENFLINNKIYFITLKKDFNKNKINNFDINNYISINKNSLEKIFKKLNNKNIIENYEFISITIFRLSQKEIEKKKKLLEKINEKTNSIKKLIENKKNIKNENNNEIQKLIFESNFNLIDNNDDNNSIIIHSSNNESEILSNFNDFSFFNFATKNNKKLLNQNLPILNIYINNATNVKNNNYKIKKEKFENYKKNKNESFNKSNLSNTQFESLNTISDFFSDQNLTIFHANEKVTKKINFKKKSNSILISHKKNFSISKHFYSKSDINGEIKKFNVKSSKFYLIKDIFDKKKIINKNDLENINEALNSNKINVNNLINVFDVYNKIIYFSFAQFKYLMKNLEENLYLKCVNNKNVYVYVNKNKIFEMFNNNKNCEKFEIEDYLNKKQIVKFNKKIKEKFLLHSPVWQSIRNIYCMKIRKIHKKKKKN